MDLGISGRVTVFTGGDSGMAAKRHGRPEEVTAAVAFLGSNQGIVTTCENQCVDGSDAMTMAA